MAYTNTDPAPPTPVIMAKRPEPGRVKTRLIDALSAYQAAQVHAAMLQSVLDRITGFSPKCPVLALDGDTDQPFHNDDPALHITVPANCKIIDQGTGNLGDRLMHTWRSLGGGPIAFFGVDSPDAPKSALTVLFDALSHADAAIGPVADGGYWCLAARQYAPELLTDIDWGTSAVYHQTLESARKAGLTVRELATWHDVDDENDLNALQQRLRTSNEPALITLRDRLARITQDSTP